MLLDQAVGSIGVAIGGSCLSGLRAPLLEDPVDDDAIDSLECQLAPECDLPSRSGPVARFDPAPSERLVVEHAEVQQSSDGAVDEHDSIARVSQTATHLRDRTRSRLEEPHGGIEHELRIVDLRSASAPFREGLAPPGRGGRHSASSMPSTGRDAVAILVRIWLSISVLIGAFDFRNSLAASRPWPSRVSP